MTEDQTIEAPPAEPAIADGILYRSDHIEVRSVPAAETDIRVVTFESYHNDIGFDRSGFGQNFFQREGISAIHVLSADNDWFQYPEMDAVLALIRAEVSGAHRVFAYGSSMGGYAAIRFADAIGATHVLALSPQYTIDRRRMPVERRWYREQKRIAFRPEYNGPIRCSADVIVAYDSELKIDATHANRIARDIPIRHLRLPYAGHPVGTFLNETGVLQPLASGYARGDVDVAAVAADAMARCEQSSIWLADRSSRFSWRDRATALDHARRAVEITPNNATVLYHYGMRLHELRDYRAAAEEHGKAVALEAHPGFIVAWSKALFFSGDHPGALAAAEHTVRAAPFEHAYIRWQGRVRADMGDHEGAARDYREVFRIRPTLRSTFGVVRRHLRWYFERARRRLRPSAVLPAGGASAPGANPEPTEYHG